ncbi:non-ribosomal peptide synthetase [Streptantibioticus silvisoli]|uniref:Amino acid adenylation domain-containing protein n=1 Tax=Streptantibioticus silvisoli TaxID=2705255 RepID=A0ABT6VXX3_9ACTN|nr:non-ribosomal peptide synthetase [Streptantibioticus silvisoli]MDI5963345.1 amino acid adenylation domain-containing protein [Streptantibioticus silvisoli]
MAPDQDPADRPAAVRLPLSAAQRDIWMAHDVDRTGSRYNVGECREILGAIDPGVLADAWYQLAREADVLRIRGTESGDDGIWQIIDTEPGDRRLRQLDLSAEADPFEAARAWMAADLAVPFDLTDGGFGRHALIRLADDRFVYYQGYHHLAIDGMTLALLDARLIELYERALAGEPWGPTPFASLAELLAEDSAYRSSQEAADDRAHWARHLAGVPETPRIGEGRSAGRDRVPAPFVRRIVHVSGADTDRLKTLARARHTTWPMLFVTMVAAYVHRISGHDELVVGLPVTGRTTELSRRTPGMTSNVIPLRIAVGTDRSLAELATEVTAEVRGGLKHQRTRYEDMCRDLGIGESERRITAPLVNIMAFVPGLTFGGHATRQHNLGNGPVEDLAIAVYDLGPGLGLRIDFDAAPEVCDLVAVDAHQDRFLRFIGTLLDSPELPLRTLPVLGDEERHLVTEGWNNTGAPLDDASLPTLVERQAAERPDQPAVIFGEHTLTYSELNTRANQLAHHLTQQGLTRGHLAGILLDRGIPFAITLLAVTKTGAAYALLDPEFPDTRLTTTAHDAHLHTLITDTTHTHRLTGPWTTVTTDTTDLHGQPHTNPEHGTTTADTACVMFTSGSTGKPKGILSTHHNLISTLTHQTYATFGPHQTFLQCSPVSWDAFSLEYWGALLHGGTTVLQPGQRPDPAHITRLTAQHGVTMLQLSSSLFNHLTDDAPETFAGVHTAYTGGEPASPHHVARLQARYPALTITNGYGPAESMGFTTTHTITADSATDGTIPIGTPLTNKRAYVLDAHLNPVPPGTVGELYLAGDGIATGYLGQPTTTATRFIPNPHGPTGTRLYRTGDQAHWDTHGNLHYTGRTDTQIKIRGFRVEPTEIETALTGHPHITQAVVTTYPDRHGTPQLTAHVTAAPGHEPDGRAVRGWLRERLPEHMVPASITVLERMPLTANGKVDKRALPAPVLAVARGRAARTPLEEILCGLFTDVLAAPEPLTIDDSFFDHGGHSLLAARLTSRVARALTTRLTMRDVFLHPTPAALAQHLGTLAAHPAPQRPALTAVADRPERLPLSPAQRRLWMACDLESGGAAYNVPLSVRLDGELDADALHAAFRDLTLRHEPLRTVVSVVDGEPYQVVRAPHEADVPFERRLVSADELDAALTAAAGHPFDLAADLPLRVTLFDLGGDAYVLLVLLHHLATDGQSVGPLFTDLATAYTARRAGGEPTWSPLPVGYPDYALWQRRMLGAADDTGSVLGGELAYWREALAGLPQELGLTTDRPRPAAALHRGGAVEVDFGTELHRAVAALARAEQCTPFMVLHAALAAVLTRLGAGTDIPVGSPVAGRSDEALAALVGFFVNTLVLRADTSGNPSFRDLLARVRTADLEAFAHQEAPFDQVLDAVGAERSLSRHPLFQVCLALENGTPAPTGLPGVRCGAVRPVPHGSVKFDLEFLLSGDDAGGLTGLVLFDSGIFDAATVRRTAAMLRRVLEQATADPAVTLAAVDLLDPAERHLVTEGWNATDTPLDDASLPTLVERQAAERPDQPAVIFGEHTLTYSELNTRANQLAHHLTQQGLTRGHLAGILLDRGIPFAITLLAVTKTGAAYALLDPEFPDTRLTTTAHDAHLHTLITDTTHTHRLTGPWTTVTTDTTDLHGQPHTNPEHGTTTADTACVMFTSGSTGKPKGILSTHHNLISTLTHQTYATFGPHQTFLQCSPVSWDAFSLEYWGALLHGGTTVLQPGQRPDPGLITELTQRHSVTMLQLSSSLFNHLTDDAPETFAGVHTAYTGGEPASPHHVARLQARYPALTITNGYGPAESMGFTTTYAIPADGATASATVPIGTPLTNKRAYVLDAHLNPVPPGTVGELYLAGDGIATGYLGQPTTTATRFIPNPHGPTGTRLYRTGDQAHWDTHGNLHYTGRTDTQIKIRGFRVEPTEIETALTGHPHITQAVVTTHPDSRGALQLVAHVTVSPEHTTDAQELRAWTRTRLPDHLVPASITVLERMPLTANGKVDKRALPAPAAALSRGRAPRNGLERLVGELFTEILAVPEPLTIDDNFFDHGGHSLLAARLTSRVAAALGARTTVRDVFLHPTPAAFAEHLTARFAVAEDGTAAAPAPARRARPALRRRTESGALLGS